MTRHLRDNAVAYLALFVALGGSAYAAASLPKNSVGPGQIRKNAVRRSEIASNAVRQAEIARWGVGRIELHPDAVGSAQVEDGALGLADLGFRPALAGEVTGGGVSEQTDMNLAADAGFTTVATAHVSVPQNERANILLFGSVNAEDPSPGGPAVTLETRVLVNGIPEEGSFTQTIGDGESGTNPFSFVCNGEPAGDYTVALQVRTDGSGALTIADRTLDTARFTPIFSPPS